MEAARKDDTFQKGTSIDTKIQKRLDSMKAGKGAPAGKKGGAKDPAQDKKAKNKGPGKKGERMHTCTLYLVFMCVVSLGPWRLISPSLAPSFPLISPIASRERERK